VSAALSDPRIAAGMRAQFELRRAKRDAGGRQVGWKVGFGAPAAKEKLKIAMPLVGFLMDSALLPSGTSVSLKGWQRPVAEPEIAVYIGHDLPGSADRASVRSAIAAIGPAIELADIDCPVDDVQAILSGDIFQRHVILGPKDASRAGARLDGLSGRVTRFGADVPVPADLEAPTGELIGIVKHVADIAAALGDGLRAGQFIICGSVTPPLFLEAADTAVEWALEPGGSVSIRFSHQ
jgi:2-keto-4-pentenoate hydratase